MSEVAHYQSYAKERRNRLVAFLAVTFAVLAIALTVLWLLPAAEFDEEILEAQAPKTYEDIFEVFVQARTRTLEEGELSSVIEDEALSEDEEYIDAEYIDADEVPPAGNDHPDEESSPEDMDSEESLIPDEEVELDDFYNDLDALVEYLAMLEDLALLEDDGMGDENQSAQNEEHLAENEEDPFAEDEDGFAEEDEYLSSEDEDYLEEDSLYFDEDEIFTGMQSVSMGFSPSALLRLAEEDAQNPHYLQSYSTAEGSYLFVQSPEAIHILAMGSEDVAEPLAHIPVDAYLQLEVGEPSPDGELRANNTVLAKRFVSMFLVDGRLITISVSGQEDSDYSNTFTNVQVFDLNAAANPELISSYIITGLYSGSRMTQSTLVLATEHAIFDLDNLRLEALETFVPFVVCAKDTHFVLPDDIRIAGDIEQRETVYTQLISIDTADETQLSSQVAFLGGNEAVYAGENTIYLVNNSELQQGRRYQITSSLTQVHIQEDVLKFGAYISLPGIIEGLCSLDEGSSGVLRVVAPDFTYSESTEIAEIIGIGQGSAAGMQIFILDEQLEIIANLEDFGTDEILYPQHFVDDMLFLGTEENGNRSYQVDLSDPANPRLITEPAAVNLPEILLPWSIFGEAGTANAAALEGITSVWIGLGDTAEPWDDFALEGSDGELVANIEEEVDLGDSGLELGIFSLSAGVLSSDHIVPVGGYYFTDAVIYPESLFVQAATGIIAFPADESFLVYSFDASSGFSRQLEHSLGEDFYPNMQLRSSIVGEYFVLMQQTDNLEIWFYHLTDFSEAGHLDLSS